ncbi:MAG: DUF6069 family protein [Solirubrobacteraceae bacterium]
MLLARALVVLAAVAGALLVWVIADPLLKADLDVRFGDSGAADHVAARAVAVTTLVLALLGWGLLELLERRYGSPRGDDLWVAAAVVAMLLSLLGPIIAGLTISATVGLLAIHITAGAILIALLPQGIRLRGGVEPT